MSCKSPSKSRYMSTPYPLHIPDKHGENPRATSLRFTPFPAVGEKIAPSALAISLSSAKSVITRASGKMDSMRHMRQSMCEVLCLCHQE